MNALESLLFVSLLFVGLLFVGLLFGSLLFVTRSNRGCKEQAVVASLRAVCKGMCSQARWLARWHGHSHSRAEQRLGELPARGRQGHGRLGKQQVGR